MKVTIRHFKPTGKHRIQIGARCSEWSTILTSLLTGDTRGFTIKDSHNLWSLDLYAVGKNKSGYNIPQPVSPGPIVIGFNPRKTAF